MIERIGDRLYHDTIATPELIKVRTRVREMAESIVAPVASRLATQDERRDGFPRDVFGALAKAGLYRIPFPKDVGGEGLDNPAAATAIAVEELAYYSNSVAAMFDVH